MGVARLASSRWVGIALAALLCGLYAQGVQGGPGWVLGFVALVPWLRALDRAETLGRALLSAWAMAVAYTGAVFYWFGSALGAYTQIGTGMGLALLLVAAPLLQPQFLALALVRHLARHHHGRGLAALAAAAAWLATEWAWPHVLGDTLGHGLHPAPWLRQGAAVIGATGLTALLLLANEAVTAALARRAAGPRAVLAALALAAAAPLAMALAGLATTADAPPGTPNVRMGLVQANITDYERRRREQGAGAVVREVLDTHFAMSYDAVEHRRVDAVLWSETVYPTTFGQPKSDAGAALDAELRATIEAAGVPFVFGTYDRDGDGEYNAAAIVQPGAGLVGMYHKTRLFPFTEALPAWLDTPAVRAVLPGAGQWRPGSGARVFPLRVSGGREVPALPLICLDDTDPRLALDGARLGAQLILTLSNDEWFTQHPQGAALHQAVAAFRSIETGLPQFRVTTNGLSAVISARGELLATGRLGERTLVIGDLPVRDPAPTLMVRWGDWVGRAAAALLTGLALLAAWRRWSATATPEAEPPLPADVSLLPPAARAVAGGLRALSRGGALAIAGAWLLGEGTLTGNTLALLRTFTALCVVPEAAAWLLMRSSTAQLRVARGALHLTRGERTITVRGITAAVPWRVPLPAAGVSLQGEGGASTGLMVRDAWALAAALGVPVSLTPAGMVPWLQARAAHRPSRLAQPAAKFVLLPLLLAVPAFTLHQNIAYGSPLGEFHSFGLTAYLVAFGLWWAAWVAGVVACAAVVRLAVEALALPAAFVRPATARTTRAALEQLGHLALYLGLPAWLLMRATA